MQFVGVTGLTWPELASPGTCIQIVAAVMIGVGLHKASRAAVALSADEACLPSADGGLGDPGQAAAAIGGGVAGAGPGGRKRTELEICARAPHRRAVDIERSESATAAVACLPGGGGDHQPRLGF